MVPQAGSITGTGAADASGPPAVAARAEPVVADVGGVRLVLHARRLRGDRSLVEAARLVGLNRDELGRIERGETTQVRFSTIAKLLAAYGCSLSDLVEVTNAPQPPAVPLYTEALAALAAGLLPATGPQRRRVRRSSAPDLLTPGEDSTFGGAPTARRRRRGPVGTMPR